MQAGLFDRPAMRRAKARMRAVDKLNRRFGRDTVRFAATAVSAGLEAQQRIHLAALHDMLGRIAAVPDGTIGQGVR